MLIIPIETGKVSDGFHTFDELYEHRCSLFLALMKLRPDISWFSECHEDKSKFAGWFIAGICLPTGSITYHLPNRDWGDAVKTGAKRLEVGMKWDGHKPEDVVKRLRAFLSYQL